jgi:hypothetical protein
MLLYLVALEFSRVIRTVEKCEMEFAIRLYGNEKKRNHTPAVINVAAAWPALLLLIQVFPCSIISL